MEFFHDVITFFGAEIATADTLLPAYMVANCITWIRWVPEEAIARGSFPTDWCTRRWKARMRNETSRDVTCDCTYEAAN